MGPAPTSATGAPSVLVLTALPDDRESTAQLALLVDELRTRRGARVTVWYLRCLDHQTPPPGTRVVDRLRTIAPLRALDAVGAGAPASWVRGRLLRRWMAEVRPDLVVLDDGLGDRVLDVLDPRPPVVVRHNAVLPDFAELEPPARERGDLTIVPPGAADEGDDDPTVLLELPWPDPDGTDPGRPFRDADRRDGARNALDLPTGVPLVVGWGDDGWLDGPDLFVRTLWALEHRHGVTAHGVWFGLAADRREAERILTEADRCGLGGRLHHRPTTTLDGQLCGDAVLLPYRSPTDPADLLPAMVAGAAVVTFRSTAPVGPGVVRVDELDVEAAATALATALAEDRDGRVEHAAHLMPEPIAAALVALAGTRRR